MYNYYKDRLVGSTIRFGIVGDNVLSDPILAENLDRKSGTYDFFRCYQELMRYVGTCDIAAVNMCAPLSPDSMASGSRYFAAPYSAAFSLFACNFNLFLHASANAGDMGSDAIRNTIDYYDSIGMPCAGIRKEKSAPRYTTICVDDIRVGIVNYTYSIRKDAEGEPTADGKGLHRDERWMVNVIEDGPDQFLRDVRSCSRANDVTIVCLHTNGCLITDIADTRVRKILKAIDEGAGLIMVSGPNDVLECVEIETVKGNTALVCPSIGPFFQRSQISASRMDGNFVVFEIMKNSSRAIISYPKYIPFHIDNSDGYTHITPQYAQKPHLLRIPEEDTV